MKKKGKPAGRRLIKSLRRHFLAGILVIVPIGIAVAVLAWVFTNIDNILQPVISRIFGQEIIGLGFAVAIVLIYIIGIIAENIIGKRAIHFGESLLTRVPVFRQIYTGAKQVVESLSGAGLNKAAFREVVFVEFPREGMKTIAFITNEITDKSGRKLFTIYVPTAPLPASGYLVIVTEDKLIRTDLAVDEAMTMIISSGMASPPELDIEGITKSKTPRKT